MTPRIVAFCVVALWLTTVPSIAGEAHSSVMSPEDCVENFYYYLLSDIPVDDCPDLFSAADVFSAQLRGPEVRAASSNLSPAALCWAYLRDNRQLFLFPTIQPTNTPAKARSGYYFTGFPRTGLFIDGSMFYVVSGLLAPGGSNGVLKQIMFSVTNIAGPTRRYAIDLTAIMINGVSLDPAREFTRKGCLYTELGFDEDSLRTPKAGSPNNK